jgi:ketosteroid isomerase-like protein
VEFASETVRGETLARDGIDRFYEALNRLLAGQAAAMGEVWAQSPDAVLMGPFGGRQLGTPDVQRVFQRDAGLKKGGSIAPRDMQLRVGRDLAYGVCIERGEVITSSDRKVAVELRATNILTREVEGWKVLCHHTDPLREMQDASGYQITEFTAPAGEVPDSELLKVVDRLYGNALPFFLVGYYQPLEAMWLRADDVTLAGPAGNLQVGWPAVRAEIQRRARQNIRGHVEYLSPFIRVRSDLAFVSCLASAPDLTVSDRPCPLSLRTTIVFRREGGWLRREGGPWKIVHLHEDLDAGLAGLINPAGE